MTDTGFDRRKYIGVTAAYWVFTLSDGALRMLVLLHFHGIGYTAFQVAMLFLLYEFFGMVSNLVGGWVAAHMGLRSTLNAGLAIQVLALIMLSLQDASWAISVSVMYVMATQALSGIAKDLTKMSSKSAVKLVSGEAGLFKRVAVLTGSKNAVKGAGFFVGGLLLSVVGFVHALWLMAAVLLVVLLLSAITLPAQMGRMKQKPALKSLWSKSTDINVLSVARLFLFGSRDVWFAVGLPLFLVSALQWSYYGVGAFMAAWVIGYGLLQASTPLMLRNHKPNGHTAFVWSILLGLLLLAMLAAGKLTDYDSMIIISGLVIFGWVFAVNSAVHSYLILAYSRHEDVTLNVGFYYMANAAGRLVGTVLSGLAYQWQGIWGCLATALLFICIASIISYRLR